MVAGAFKEGMPGISACGPDGVTARITGGRCCAAGEAGKKGLACGPRLSVAGERHARGLSARAGVGASWSGPCARKGPRLRGRRRGDAHR